MKTPNTLEVYKKIIEEGSSILGIDYGEKKSGLSLFRPSEDFAPYPYKTLKTPKTIELFIDELKKIIKENEIKAIVLGIPYLTDGKETTQTKKLKKLLNKLSNDFPDVDIFSQDETLSSFEAEKRMESSPLYNFKADPSKIDEVAATIILEDFLKLLKKN